MGLEDANTNKSRFWRVLKFGVKLASSFSNAQSIRSPIVKSNHSTMVGGKTVGRDDHDINIVIIDTAYLMSDFSLDWTIIYHINELVDRIMSACNAPK